MCFIQGMANQTYNRVPMSASQIKGNQWVSENTNITNHIISHKTDCCRITKGEII